MTEDAGADAKKYRNACRKLHDYIEAEGYRFNTSVGAVFLDLLYKCDENQFYDFMERWAKQKSDLQLTRAEQVVLEEAFKKTSIEDQLVNATPGGIGREMLRPCGRRMFMKAAGQTIALAVAAGPTSRLANMMAGPPEEAPACDAGIDSGEQGATSSGKNTKKENTVLDQTVDELQKTYSTDWLKTFVLLAAGVTTARLGSRLFDQMNNKRDRLVDLLSQHCENSFSSQLSNGAAIER